MSDYIKREDALDLFDEQRLLTEEEQNDYNAMLCKKADDYIKREDVIEAVCGDCPYNCSEVRKEMHPCMEYKELMAIPSADVEPVVRCKDCASFRYSGMGGDNGILYCTLRMTEMQPTDFCSYGERENND